MREFMTQWVRLCESVCAPDRVVWCEELAGLEDTGEGEQTLSVFVTPVTRDGERVGPTRIVSDLTKLSFATSDAKGALQNRTMYIVPFCTKAKDSCCGIVVTDSPGIVNEYRKRYTVGVAAWKTLFQSDSCTATLRLVFPACYVSYTLRQARIGDSREFVASEKLPPDLKLKVRGSGHYEADDDYFPLFTMTSRRCKRSGSHTEIRELVGKPSFLTTIACRELVTA